jgi:predicted ArsR family transcriptional regulator
VKIGIGVQTGADASCDRSLDRADRTRDAVARTILEQGPHSAADLAERLGLSAAGVRRHLDALVADGLLVERDPRPTAHRGRGRPARTYALTDAGRAAFPHAYDDLASTALRYLRDTGGDAAVAAFANHRAESLVRELEPAVESSAPLPVRVHAVAEALSAHGYASTTQAVSGDGAEDVTGVQICQHHCPVAHVAAEFPQLCEAETRALEQLLGTYAQRLATIAHGDGVCTTHVPVPRVANRTSITSTDKSSTDKSSTDKSSTDPAPLGGTEI